MNTLEILEAGRSLISDAENWTQGSYARDSFERSITPTDKYAIRWCSAGALRKVIGTDTEKVLDVMEILRDNLIKLTGKENYNTLTSYNDNRTHSEVLKLWDTAIENEKLKGN